MGAFTYQPRKPEAWDKRGQQSGGNFASYIKDEFQVFSPKKGDQWIRILPPTWPNPSHYGQDIWVHFGVGPDNGTVLCPAKMDKKKCPVCEYQIKAEAQGREDASDFKPTRRVAVWIINRKVADDKGQPFVWAMPWTVDRDISKICKDKQTGEIYQIDHPYEGYDVMFERDGEPPAVKYIGTQLARKASAVDQKYLDFITANPIPTVLLTRSYEEIEVIFGGGAPAAEVAPADKPTQASVAQTVAVPAAQVAPAALVAAVPAAPTPTVAAPAPTPLPTASFVLTKPQPAPGFCPEVQELNNFYMGCKYGPHEAGVPHACEINLGPVPPAAVTNGAAVVAPVPAAAKASSPSEILRNRYETGAKA